MSLHQPPFQQPYAENCFADLIEVHILTFQEITSEKMPGKLSATYTERTSQQC